MIRAEQWCSNPECVAPLRRDKSSNISPGRIQVILLPTPSADIFPRVLCRLCADSITNVFFILSYFCSSIHNLKKWSSKKVMNQKKRPSTYVIYKVFGAGPKTNVPVDLSVGWHRLRAYDHDTMCTKVDLCNVWYKTTPPYRERISNARQANVRMEIVIDKICGHYLCLL